MAFNFGGTDLSSIFGANDPMGVSPALGRLLATNPEAIIPQLAASGARPPAGPQLAAAGPFGGYASALEQQQAEENKNQWITQNPQFPAPPPAPIAGMASALDEARGGRPSPFPVTEETPGAEPAAPANTRQTVPDILAPLVPQQQAGAVPRAGGEMPKAGAGGAAGADGAGGETASTNKKPMEAVTGLLNSLAGVKAPPAPPVPPTHPYVPRGENMPQGSPIAAMLASVMSGQNPAAAALLRLQQTVK